MKIIAKSVLASLVIAFSSAAMADNIDVTASGNIAIQLQDGHKNWQEMKVAVVTNKALNNASDIDIDANNNLLIQAQTGSKNDQTMSIATVGCNCH